MRKNFLLLVLFVVFFLSLGSVILILNFVDPSSSGTIGIISLFLSFLFCVGTFFSLFLYFIKKIYYRGDVFLYHVNTSFRQGFFVSIFVVLNILLYHFSVFNSVNMIMSFFFFFFLELLIKNFEESI